MLKLTPRPLAAIGAVLLPVMVVSHLDSHGPGRVELGFGPGDSPYIEGFQPFYEVVGEQATHWTTYDAAVVLPIEVRGGPVTLSYRYARDFPQTAEVEIRLAGNTIDRFSARGGVFQERSVRLASVNESPFVLSILSDSHERRNMGLKLDWLRIDYGDRAQVRLAGWARWRPLLVILLLLVAMLALGWTASRASLLAAVPSLALSVGLWTSPWLTHRFLTGIPLGLAGYLLLAIGIGAVLVRRGLVSPATRRLATTLAIFTFLVRALFVSHPNFYHPDLRTHATLVEIVRDAGIQFFVSPATYIEKHDVWVTGAYGRTYAFPYSPAFHLPFALVAMPYDTLITYLKLAGAAWSTLPLIWVWVLARRFGVSVWGSVLMAVIPTYTSRLSFAFLPSLFGHAVDVGFITWLAFNYDHLKDKRTWIVGGFLVAACQLAYVSGVLNVSLLVGVLVTIELVRRKRAEAFALATMLVGGSILSFALFYRGFLDMVVDLVSRVGSGAEEAESRYPVRGFFATVLDRTYAFFGWLYPLLTAVGLAGLWNPITWGWLGTYFALLFGRAKFPDIFLHGHETLFLTPLVCLASGAILGRLWQRGGWRGWVSLGLLSALTLQGFDLQWRAIASQLLPP